jgi:hypothetical protein
MYVCPGDDIYHPIKLISLGVPRTGIAARRTKSSSPVLASINGDVQIQHLHAWDDWSHLTFTGGNIGNSVIELPPILPTF